MNYNYCTRYLGAILSRDTNTALIHFHYRGLGLRNYAFNYGPIDQLQLDNPTKQGTKYVLLKIFDGPLSTQVQSHEYPEQEREAIDLHECPASAGACMLVQALIETQPLF